MTEGQQSINPPNVTQKNSHLRKRWLIHLTAVFLLIGLGFFIYWAFIGRFYETTDDAYVSGNLVEVMPEISGHVTGILADETDLVKKGETIVTLDKANAVIDLDHAKSQLALTIRQVNQLYKNIAQLQANVQVAQDNLEKAKEDYQRRQGLVVNKTISVEDLQHAKIAFDTAMATLTSVKNELATATALVGNTDLYHHPQIQEAIVNLRNAYLTWQRTTITAPETGYVAKRQAEVGQQVNPNTVLMIIVPLNQIWVNANFKESQLKNFRIGQSTQLISDTYNGDVTFHGIVIGLNPGAGSSFDLLPPQNATGNWIKIVQRLPVRIAIDPKQLEKYPLRIGLSMTVTVDTHHREGIVLTKSLQNKMIYQTKDDTAELKQANQIIDTILRENAKDIMIPTSP